MYLLADDRDDGSFKKVSFSGFPKRDILSAIRREILKGDPATTARWVAEAHASGWIAEMFDVYEQIAVKDIGIGNPRIFPYIQERRDVIRQAIQGKHSFLETRNDATVRYVLLEIAMIEMVSQKRVLGKLKKLKEKDLGSEECLRRLRCFEEKHVDSIWDTEKDPASLKGVYNELFGAIQRQDLDLTMYWIAWLQMWEKIGQPTPSGDAPEECPVTLQGWVGWKIWKYLLSGNISTPGLIHILYKMSCRDIRGNRKTFRDDCLLLACVSVCETLDASRPLVRDTGDIVRKADSSVTDRVYREMVESMVH
jgi:hypothetical protein